MDDLEQGLLPAAHEVFEGDEKKEYRWCLGFLYLLCIFGVIGIFLYLFIRFMIVH